MKLKQLPEDFIVEEIANHEILPNGKYKLFLLQKKGLESIELIHNLAKLNNIPICEFGYAGLKDKHACTKQHFTIPNKYEIKTKIGENFSVKFLGFCSKRIMLGDLVGNNFKIVVRDLRKGDVNGLDLKAKALSKFGVPNYFDSQRFGSVVNGKFLAKFLLKKDYEGAVKAYLTEVRKFDSNMIQDEKKHILANWPNIEQIKSNSDVIKEYQKTKNWLLAYQKIPKKIREMIIAAYQSYLWNECVKELLVNLVDKKTRFTVEYSLGALIFFKSVNSSLPEKFQTVSEFLKPTVYESKIVNKVLAKQKVVLQDFSIKTKTGSFFVSHDRNVVIKPFNLNLSELLVDEINDKGTNSFFKLVVSFSLPKGSYATLITKRLFNQ